METLWKFNQRFQRVSEFTEYNVSARKSVHRISAYTVDPGPMGSANINRLTILSWKPCLNERTQKKPHISQW